ncbi:MAG: S8 family serine peptidase, partial [Chloroflexota bacterium]
NSASADEVDRIHIAANSAAREAVIAAAFGSVDDALSGPLADERNINGPSFSPHLFGRFTPEEIDILASDPNVEIIQPDVPVPPTMDQSTAHIDMPPVWTAGGIGTNRTVAVLDTGTKGNHEFLQGAIISEACYNTNFSGQSASSLCPGGVENSTASGSGADCSENTAQGCSHGTHVAGTVLGNNSNRQSGEPRFGMAYNGRLISVNVFSLFGSSSGFCRSGTPSSCVLSYTTDQIQGLNRVYALRNTYNIDAINMSLGGGQYFSACDSDTRTSIITTLRNAGIATVIAAGNDGFNTSVGAPGCISNAITVASSLDTSDSRSFFSNWGSLIDVVAPGSNIQSSVYGGSSSATSTYSNYNGTSMATPHVAGAFAALRQLYPTATVTQIETALESTGVNISSAGTTKPRIDMDAACASLGGGSCGAATSGPIVA